MGLEQPSYLIQKAAPIIMRELQPYISAKVGPFLAAKVGMPLAKNVGLPLAKRIGVPLARRSGTFLLNRVGYPLLNKMLFKGKLSTLLGTSSAIVKTPQTNPTALPQTAITDPVPGKANQTVKKKGLLSVLNPRAGKGKENKRKANKANKKSKSGPSGSSGLFGRRNRNSLLNYSNDMRVPPVITDPLTNTAANPTGGPAIQPSQGPIFPTQSQQAPADLNDFQGFDPYNNSPYQSSLFSRKRSGFDFN